MDWEKEDDKVIAERAQRDIPYFSVSLTRLAALSILTFGIYNLFWFYRNWQSIKEVTKEKISPGWRAWFTAFFAWQLFERVADSAAHKGYRMGIPTGLLGFIYVIGSFIQYGIGRYSGSNPIYGYISIGLLVLTTMALLPVQAAINYNNDRLPKELQKSHRRKVIDVVMVTISILMVSAIFIGLLTDSEKQIPQEQLTQINSARDTMNSLTTEYESCSNALNSEYGSLDKSSQAAIDDYNGKYDSCDAVRIKQNKSVEVYNTLVTPYL